MSTVNLVYRNALKYLRTGSFFVCIQLRSQRSGDYWYSPGGKAKLTPEGRQFFESLGGEILAPQDAIVRIPKSKFSVCQKLVSSSHWWNLYLEPHPKREVHEEFVQGSKGVPAVLSLKSYSKLRMERVNCRTTKGQYPRVGPARVITQHFQGVWSKEEFLTFFQRAELQDAEHQGLIRFLRPNRGGAKITARRILNLLQ